MAVAIEIRPKAVYYTLNLSCVIMFLNMAPSTLSLVPAFISF
jgi:hypothetical protein